MKKWISEQLCISQASFTCNLYCRYCHNPPTGRKEDISSIIDEVKKHKYDAVSLEGKGEPLINKDIENLIKELKNNGINHIMISTNGIALSNLNFLKKIEKNVEFFVMNFPSHIEGIYNNITRSVKYKMAIAALDNMKKLGILHKLRIFHIINSYNYKYLSDFVDWINKNYKDIFLLNFCFVRNKGRAEKEQSIIPKYSDVSKYLKLALAKSKLYKIKTISQNIPLCMIKGFEGFSFEFHRWLRGDKVFERGVDSPLRLKKCSYNLFELEKKINIIKKFIDAGLKSIIIKDLGLISIFYRCGIKNLKFNLSSLNLFFNSYAFNEIEKYNIKRVIFPLLLAPMEATKLIELLRSKKIETEIFYYPLHNCQNIDPLCVFCGWGKKGCEIVYNNNFFMPIPSKKQMAEYFFYYYKMGVDFIKLSRQTSFNDAMDAIKSINFLLSKLDGGIDLKEFIKIFEKHSKIKGLGHNGKSYFNAKS